MRRPVQKHFNTKTNAQERRAVVGPPTKQKTIGWSLGAIIVEDASRDSDRILGDFLGG